MLKLKQPHSFYKKGKYKRKSYPKKLSRNYTHKNQGDNRNDKINPKPSCRISCFHTFFAKIVDERL